MQQQRIAALTTKLTGHVTRHESNKETQSWGDNQLKSLQVFSDFKHKQASGDLRAGKVRPEHIFMPLLNAIFLSAVGDMTTGLHGGSSNKMPPAALVLLQAERMKR